MGAIKVLIGLVFVILGVVLTVLVFAPIPGFENISITDRIMRFFDPSNPNYLDIMTLTFPQLFQAIGFILIDIILPYVGYQYTRAGIKSMRYQKEKKKYYYTETKIALFIVGFIIICVAVTLVLTILLQILSPVFQFIADLIPAIAIPPSLIPQLLIPVILTLLTIFFIYWLGSIIMKKGIKKEEIYK